MTVRPGDLPFRQDGEALDLPNVTPLLKTGLSVFPEIVSARTIAISGVLRYRANTRKKATSGATWTCLKISENLYFTRYFALGAELAFSRPDVSLRELMSGFFGNKASG